MTIQTDNHFVKTVDILCMWSFGISTSLQLQLQ
jgi:hypothetical protein